MVRAFLFVFFFSLFAVPLQAHAFSMSVSPALKNLELNRGETAEFTISFTNQAVTADFQVEISDFVYEPAGGTRVLASTQLTDPSQSLIEWIELDSVLSAKKGEVNKVPVKITIPDFAMYGDHYGMLVFRQKPQGDNAVVSIQGGITVLLYIKVLGGNQIKAGELASFTSVSQERARNTVNFLAEYRNTGNQFFKVMAEVEVFSAETDPEPITTLRKDFTSYPNVLSSIRIPLGDLGEDYGEREYLAKLKIYDFTDQKKAELLAEKTHTFQYYLPYTGHGSADTEVQVVEKVVPVESSVVQVIKELGLYIGGFIILLVVLIRVLFFHPAPVAVPQKRGRKK